MYSSRIFFFIYKLNTPTVFYKLNQFLGEDTEFCQHPRTLYVSLELHGLCSSTLILPVLEL